MTSTRKVARVERLDQVDTVAPVERVGAATDHAAVVTVALSGQAAQ
ncbi:MAG: hypothetical protein ABJF23_34275 [Bryobacteraceae bacterium]